MNIKRLYLVSAMFCVFGISSAARADSYILTRMDQAAYRTSAKTIMQYIANGSYRGTSMGNICGIDVKIDGAIHILAAVEGAYWKDLLPVSTVTSNLVAAIVTGTPLEGSGNRLRIVSNFGNETGYEIDALDLVSANGVPVSLKVGVDFNNNGRLKSLRVDDTEIQWSETCKNLTKVN